jgi:hypothetical protein
MTEVRARSQKPCPRLGTTEHGLLTGPSYLHPGNGLSFSTFVNTVPINEHRTVNRFALIRNLQTPIAPGLANSIFNMGIWDKFAHNAMIK